MTIFIGNIGSDIGAGDLFQLFSKFGTVIWADVATDNELPKGYGYVRMRHCTEGNNAIAALNKKRFKQQYLSVGEALSNQSKCVEYMYG